MRSTCGLPLTLALLTAACQPDSAGQRLPLPAQSDTDLGDAASPDALPAATPDAAPRPTRPPPDQLRVATYNVENLFDLQDDPRTDEGEFTPAAGRWDAAHLATRLTRLAGAFSAINADVVLVNEVENVGVLTDLRDAISAHGGPRYDYVGASPSRDPRGIVIGVMSRHPILLDAGRPIAREHHCQGQDGPVTLDGSWTEARPIYQIELDFDGDGQRDMVLLGNHWKAKGASFPCDGDEHRLRSGLALRDVIDSLLDTDERLPVIGLGDLNTHEFEPPIAEALGATLDRAQVQGPRDLYDVWGELGVVDRGRNSNEFNSVENSSYNFRGLWGRLDHILLSGNMRPGGEAAWQLVVGSAATVRIDGMLNAQGTPADYDVRSGEGYSDHLPLRVDLRRVQAE